MAAVGREVLEQGVSRLADRFQVLVAGHQVALCAVPALVGRVLVELHPGGMLIGRRGLHLLPLVPRHACPPLSPLSLQT